MILTLTPNPCVDKTIFLDRLEVGTFMRAPRYACIAGGKGVNVARAAHVMGAETKAMVVVGGHTGRHVVDLIEGDGVPCCPVFVESATRTITTVLEEPNHRQTAFFEPGSRVTEAERDRIVDGFREAVADARVAVLSGTVSDPAIADLYARLIPIARAAGALVLLDSHGPEFKRGLEMKPDLVKPNVAEAEECLGARLETESSRWDAVRQFRDRGVATVVLSLGKEGALVSRGADRFRVIPPVIREVNPVGSGDAVIAGFAIGLDHCDSLETMARLGAAMGAANAKSWDIGHFTKTEVEELIGEVRIVRADV